MFGPPRAARRLPAQPVARGLIQPPPGLGWGGYRISPPPPPPKILGGRVLIRVRSPLFSPRRDGGGDPSLGKGGGGGGRVMSRSVCVPPLRRDRWPGASRCRVSPPPPFFLFLIHF